MLSLDLKNAVSSTENNFTCQLFRLIMKSDTCNRNKLRTVYPTEVKMVEIYRCGCPYDENGQVDYEKLEEMARKEIFVI